jgi:hypothetical protein
MSGIRPTSENHMRVNERLDEAAAVARKLLVLIESARARESSDRLSATTAPSPLRSTPDLLPRAILALQAYVDGVIALEPPDALVLDDAIARLMRAANGAK